MLNLYHSPLRQTSSFLISYSLFLISYSLFLIPYSLFLIPYSLFLISYSLFIISYSLFTLLQTIKPLHSKSGYVGPPWLPDCIGINFSRRPIMKNPAEARFRGPTWASRLHRDKLLAQTDHEKSRRSAISWAHLGFPIASG